MNSQIAGLQRDSVNDSALESTSAALQALRALSLEGASMREAAHLESPSHANIQKTLALKIGQQLHGTPAALQGSVTSDSGKKADGYSGNVSVPMPPVPQQH